MLSLSRSSLVRLVILPSYIPGVFVSRIVKLLTFLAGVNFSEAFRVSEIINVLGLCMHLNQNL